MSQAISDEALQRATGKTLEEWLPTFEAMNAESLSHKEIAQQLGEAGVPGWWCQMLTVIYEQHIGRRVPGQDCEGEYSVSVSKTLRMNMDEALQWWIDLVGDATAFSDVAVTRGPDISATDNWRYWRIGLGDGSRVNVNIYEKEPGKSSLGIQHEKLESGEQVEHWRTYWKGLLASAG